MDKKYCVKCKHYKLLEVVGARGDNPHECWHPKNVSVDIVTGCSSCIIDPQFLRAQNVQTGDNFCGKDGDWFEPQEPVAQITATK